MIDARHERPSSPQELVSAAEAALATVLRANILQEHRAHMQFRTTLIAAYDSVIADPTLGPKYRELLDDTVKRLPEVEGGRVSAEDAQLRYEPSHWGPIMQNISVWFAGKENIGYEQDQLHLLKKVISQK
jgi:hypothetical protein